MKTLGLLGGTSHQAMLVYNRLIHDEVGHRLRQPGQAAVITLDRKPDELVSLIGQRDWSRLKERLTGDAKRLKAAGAEALVICSSLLHVISEEVMAAADLPVVSVVDAVLSGLRRLKKGDRVGLLGSFDEREAKMWKSFLESNLVPDVMVPVSADQEHLARIIQKELVFGAVREPSRAQLVHIMASFRKAGSRAVITTAPELRLIFGKAETVLPILDATKLHVAVAVDWALGLENVRLRL